MACKKFYCIVKGENKQYGADNLSFPPMLMKLNDDLRQIFVLVLIKKWYCRR